MNKKQKRESDKATKAEATRIEKAKAKEAEKAAAATTEATGPKAVAKPKREAKPKEPNASGMAALPKLPSGGSKQRKPKPMHDCACGCGTQTRSKWAPGHDARAKGWALRIERELLTMDDVPANERKGAQYMLDERAKERANPTPKKADLKLVPESEPATESTDAAVNE